MSELDGEHGERLAHESPDEHLRRREFLQRTAYVAGAAGLASVLPANTLIAEAARRQARVPLPSPRNMPIDTVVVLMMENRSFDHYFGWYPKADGRNEGLSFPDKDGKPVKTFRLTPEYQGCGHPDPDHSWTGGRHQMNNGRMDGFVQGNAAGDGSDEFAAGYYLKDDLGFISHAGMASTLYDRFFCSLMASTWPNRAYMWSAQSGGNKNNTPPVGSAGYPWENIFDRAIRRGVSAHYYNSDLPFSAVWGSRAIPWTSPVEDYYRACAMGTLPNIVFVDPPFKDGGGGDGTSADEHPHGDVRLGQAFMSDIAHAFMESPQWKRGALFITYDEWGGFFDHVPPPRVPDQRGNRDIMEDFGLMGFRVPTVVLSPFARRGYVDHGTYGFESILKLISYRFGLGHLNRRHRYARNIARTFDWDNPKLTPPSLPDPAAIVARPCSLGGSTEAGTRPKAHDITWLEDSGYLDRLGFDVRPSTYDRIFRQPGSVRAAYAR